jgi:hypothetical protein
MNNLDNYFGLVIMKGQVVDLIKSLIPNNVKLIHRRMKSYKWHLTIDLIHGEYL